MPNYVENHVESANTDALIQLRDFNLIIPRPLSLEVEGGSLSFTYQQLSKQGKSIDEIREELKKLNYIGDLEQVMRRYRINEKLFGCLYWYDWNIENWGTKWSSCEYELLADELCRFTTAWSHPLPIIKALSKQYPDEVFDVTFAEEDIGVQTGCYSVKNGKTIECSLHDDHSKQAYETAFLLWGCESDYKYDVERGTYAYIYRD